MLRRVQGFRVVIDTSEKELSRFAEVNMIFSRFLPYAIVFGLTEKWAKAFEPGHPAGHVVVRLQPAVHLRGIRSRDRRLHGLDRRLDRVTPASSGSSGFCGGGFSGGGGGGGGGGSW